MSNLIQEEDYSVGDMVRILWKGRVYGKVGIVIHIRHASIGIEFEDGKIEFYSLKTSVELVEKQKIKVVFT